MRSSRQTRVRQEQFALIPVEGAVEDVLPDGEKEIAGLLAISQDDLTSLDYGPGQKSRVWMSRSLQRDREAPVNRPVSHGLKINGIGVAIRGDVVVHHQEYDFGARRPARRPAGARR